MSLNAVVIFFLVISILVIAGVIARRFPEASVLDVTSLADAKNRETKRRIMQERLKRSSAAAKEKMQSVFGPVQRVAFGGAKALYERIMTLERRYQEERRRVSRGGKSGDAMHVRELLEEAEEFAEARQYAEAEQKYISVISADARNVPAYRGLAWIYLETDQLEQAKETLEFLLRLKPGDAEAIALLGEVAFKKGFMQDAEKYLRKAIELERPGVKRRVRLAEMFFAVKKPREAKVEMQLVTREVPNNPKYLDFLLESSILCGDVEVAERALAALQDVNPENQKIKEFEARINDVKMKE